MTTNQPSSPKQLAVLGSTGSIGTQTLEVVSEYPERFELYAITANNNVELLIQQAIRFQPDTVVISNEALYPRLKEALKDYPIKTYAGSDAIEQVVEASPIDVVLASMVGYAGLKPTIRALQAGKDIALANKETLVVAGEIINRLAQENHAAILPVDSEHSAVFQCLEACNPVEKILLTASGGPFRNFSLEQMKHVTKQQALKHPNWSMGAKITIDSASMMNKGFEVIEAKWLFGLSVDQIEVLVHPESVVHSMVQFQDGSIKAQMGLPDMKLPILYALSYPHRLPTHYPRVDFPQLAHLSFERPDTSRFRNLALAYEAMKQEGNMPCILNAANEVAVAAFLNEQIGFMAMSDAIAYAMQHCDFIARPTYEDYVQTDAMARRMTTAYIEKQ